MEFDKNIQKICTTIESAFKDISIIIQDQEFKDYNNKNQTVKNLFDFLKKCQKKIIPNLSKIIDRISDINININAIDTYLKQ